MNTKVRKNLAQNLTQVYIYFLSYTLGSSEQGCVCQKKPQQSKTERKTKTERKKTWKIKPAIQDLPLCCSLNPPFSRERMIWCYVHSYKAFLRNEPFSLPVQILVNVFNEPSSSDEIVNKKKTLALVETATNLAGIILAFYFVQHQRPSFSSQNASC